MIPYELVPPYSGKHPSKHAPAKNQAADADYHLLSQADRYDPASGTWVQDALSSPGIDAGDPADGIADEPLGNGGRINIGVYDGTTQTSLTHICTGKIPGDANNDC